ncbi:MAG: 3-deoxy-D-manno-octulosonic acid transferase [Bacteroidetes bacterium]|nr:3-deoxy-D-manno-octulosonic acid transferase [Bacteroidota bacterium]
MSAINNKKAKLKILLTFFSPSGYEVRKNYPMADYVFYLPMDSPSAAKKFIKIVNPSIAVFVKYDFWYFYFQQLNKKKIPLAILSATFRKNQVFFKWYGGLFRKMLDYVSHFFVQDHQSESMLQAIGFGNITVIPDTRIDRVHQISQGTFEDDIINQFLGGEKAIVGGSVYLEECNIISQLREKNLFTKKLILVPHNISDDYISNIKKLFLSAQLYTQYNKENHSDILIVNTVGLLSSLYAKAEFAIIGGGFGKSIHNILEPAAFGIPVLFGPHFHKFREAHELMNCGGAFCFTDADSLEKILQRLNPTEAGKATAAYIQQRIGGTEKAYQYLEQILSKQ